MTNSRVIIVLVGGGSNDGTAGARKLKTMRRTWMANNAIPDSIIMNMICRSLVPPVVPEVRPTEVALTSKNTATILNTINPVTRALTAMVATIAVKNTWPVQAVW